MDLKKRLARLLLAKSYKEGDFVLASGRRSDYYFDCRVTALSAEGSWLIGKLFNEILAQLAIKGVGGMSLGADPLVSATTVISGNLAVRCTDFWFANRPRITARPNLSKAWAISTRATTWPCWKTL